MDADDAPRKGGGGGGRLCGWRALPDGEVQQAYEQIHGRLCAQARNAKEARAGTNYLYQFVRLLEPTHADPRALATFPVLDGVTPPPTTAHATLIERAHEAWSHMRRAAHWSPSYLREVRTNLSRALLLVAEPLAHVVNPGMYKGACGLTEFHVRRSQRTRFSLHDCLPWRVRALPPRSVEYAMLCRIGERMASVLKSVSKNHLQSILVLFDHVLHDPPALWPPAPPAGNPDRLDERWRFLLGLSPRQWLERYAVTFAAGDGRPRRIGFDLFKRQVRYLSQFHARVLHPDTRRYIPVPQGGGVSRWPGRPATAAADDGESGAIGGGGGWSSTCSASSDGDDAAGAAAERRDLLRLLADLRHRCCKDAPDPREQAERVYAFTPAEVRRMVELACTTQEQLVLMLLLTTGLRIGGVARLQLAGPPPRAPADVPAELTTLEKHNKLRRIHPTACCRVLLARWYQQGRPTPADGSAAAAYVFPSPASASAARDRGEGPGHVGSRHVWTVCRGLFQRAGIQGPHVHPHTFRHTVVQLLFLTGSSFESISKWIGHSSTQVTAGLYGRLAHADVERSLGAGAAFLRRGEAPDGGDGDGGAGDDRNEWHALSDFLRQPYHFVEQPPPPAPADHGRHRPAAASSRETRQALLERAAAAPPPPTPRLAAQLQQQTDILRELSEHLRRTTAPS